MKQIERRLFAALLVLALCLSLLPATVFAEEAPVVITSLSEITNLSGSYKLADDITVTEPFGSDTERFNGTPELNLWIRTAPRGAEHFHWHVDIAPRLSIKAAFEWRDAPYRDYRAGR